MTMKLEFGEYMRDLPEKAERPELRYSYEDVKDVMSVKMFQLHFESLHQGYIDRYNKKKGEMKVTSVQKAETQDEKVLLFNLGGYINHSLFWLSFNPDPSAHACSDELEKMLARDFGGKEGLFSKILEAVPKIMGSGWIWLMYRKKDGKLSLEISMNQNFPSENVPLINLDLWEHAYYLQYGVDKTKYLSSLYRIIDWKTASDRLARATSK